MLFFGGTVSSFHKNDGAVFIARNHTAVPQAGIVRPENRIRAPPYSSEINNRKPLPDLRRPIYRRMRWNMYLKVNGILIEVSGDIHDEFYHYQRKDRYFSEDLKAGTYRKRENGEEIYIPPREVSLDEMMDQGAPFQDDSDVEEQVIQEILKETLQKALKSLTDEELSLIHRLYYDKLSVSEVARREGVPRKKIRKRRDRILDKLKKWF